MIEIKRYLGDGVYSEFDGHQIKLTTSTGHDSYDSNVIFLDPVVVNNLLDYVKWVTSYRSDLLFQIIFGRYHIQLTKKYAVRISKNPYYDIFKHKVNFFRICR